MPFFYYTIGGCLQARAPNYVVRQADFELYDALQARQFCYVLSPRQMGKSSLLVRSKTQLQQAGAQCAFLDMARLGNQGLTRPQWYAGVMMSLLRSFGLSKSINFYPWWQAHRGLTPVQQLSQLVEEVLISEAEGPLVYIFIDEIDTLLSLDFSANDFFAWIRNCYVRRGHDPRYRRLNFALFGAAPATDLMVAGSHPPCNSGREIALTDFTLAECASLQLGLEPWVDQPHWVLKSILDWTGGQPFLTQKLCDIAVQAAARARVVPLSLLPGMVEVWVEDLVRSHLINDWETQDDPIHLRTIENHLCWHQNRTGRVLDLCQQLLQGVPVDVDHSPEQAALLSSGLAEILPMHSFSLTAGAIALLSGLALVGCNQKPEPTAITTQGTLVTYQCENGTTFSARLSDQEVVADLPNNPNLALPKVESASGAKYSDGTTTLWDKGGETIVYTGEDCYTIPDSVIYGG